MTAESDAAQPYVPRLLSQEVSKILQSCPDVIGRNVVFLLDLLKRHSAGKTPQDHGDGKSRTANYWLTPTDGLIKDDSIP